MDDIYIIGISGGTSSGKTTVANAIFNRIGSENISYICHDYYYKDLSNLSKEEISKVNFDHPNSLDTHLLINDIIKLSHGNEIQCPIYDFTTHSRLKLLKQIKLY